MKEKPRQVVSGCCRQPWLATPTTLNKKALWLYVLSDRDKPCPYRVCLNVGTPLVDVRPFGLLNSDPPFVPTDRDNPPGVRLRRVPTSPRKANPRLFNRRG